MKNEEYVEFITGRENPPVRLKQETEKDIRLSFRKNPIIIKFLSYQLLGALFSMSVCPQFGMGLVEGHGITHIFRLMGDWACAAFCGSVFLSSGMMVAYIGMKGEELWWIWRRFKISLIILPAFMWSALMLTNMGFNLPAETPVYHLTWLVTAILVQVLWLEFRSRTYSRVFQESRG